jgi:hypothetical protein
LRVELRLGLLGQLPRSAGVRQHALVLFRSETAMSLTLKSRATTSSRSMTGSSATDKNPAYRNAAPLNRYEHFRPPPPNLPHQKSERESKPGVLQARLLARDVCGRCFLPAVGGVKLRILRCPA